MKKIIVLLSMSILLVSCGDLVEENTVTDGIPTVEVPVVEDVIDEELSEEEIDAALEELFEWLEE